jgi:hypothetical protein
MPPDRRARDFSRTEGFANAAMIGSIGAGLPRIAVR